MIYYGTDPPTRVDTSLLGARTVNLKHDAPPPRQVPLPVSNANRPTQGANEVANRLYVDWDVVQGVFMRL